MACAGWECLSEKDEVEKEKEISLVYKVLIKGYALLHGKHFGRSRAEQGWEAGLHSQQPIGVVHIYIFHVKERGTYVATCVQFLMRCKS